MQIKAKAKITVEALIDDADAHLIAGHKWIGIEQGVYGNNDSIVLRTIIKGKSVFLHRLIMNPPEGYRVRHKNGNGLDNRRENLELLPPK